jgi:hypothetical protein
MPIYMQVEGIKGSVTGKYKDWIEVLSCQVGPRRQLVQSSGPRNSRGAVAPNISAITVTKNQDCSSCDVFHWSLGGEGKMVVIEFVKADTPPTSYLRLELENTLVSTFFTSGVTGDSGHIVVESVSLTFSNCTYSEAVHH